MIGSSLILAPRWPPCLGRRRRGSDPVSSLRNITACCLRTTRSEYWRCGLNPGKKIALHRHPDYVMHALEPFKIRFCSEDGRCLRF